MSGYKTAPAVLLLDNATNRPIGFKELDGDETFFATLNAAQTGFVKPDGTAISNIPVIANWTPTDGSGAGLAFAAGTQAIYFNIGRFWFVSGRIVYPVTADTSQAAIASLPAVCGVAGQARYNAPGTIVGGGTANKISPDRGSSIAYLYTTGSTAATNAGQSGQTLDFSFCYLAP